jgi:uncharacterized membrane protein
MIRHHNRQRRGTILPLLAVCIVALVGMIAMAIDIGMVTVARTQAQNCADLAALAGARMFNGDATGSKTNQNNILNAIATANARAVDNKVLGQTLNASQVQLRTGTYAYNAAAQKFAPDIGGATPGSNAWSVMEVTISANSPTYFGRCSTSTTLP